jgi:sugar phosphate permease
VRITFWQLLSKAFMVAAIAAFAAVGFSVAILIGRSSDLHPIGRRFYLLMAAPALNFIGLLFARVAPSSRP